LILFTPKISAAIDVSQRGQSLKSDGWRQLASDVPLREVPVPVMPAAVVEMNWKEGTGEVLGLESYLDFVLPSPQLVAAIQLKYSYKHDNSPATLRAQWRRSDLQDFTGRERSSDVKLVSNPGERTATIWVNNEIIDQLRIHPNNKSCTFTLAEIVLLVPESGQPKVDSGSGEGFLDLVDEGQIAGWAWDKNQPDNAILVDIYDDDKKLTTVLADRFREDLVEAGIGNAKHCFSYPTPASLKDGKVHTIRVKTSRANKELSGCPKTISLKADSYQQLIHHIQEVVRRIVPPEATVMVVSKGDADLLKLDGPRGWHFPRPEDGNKPADSTSAIAQLEALREKGGQFLLFPEPTFWWLDHYQEFKRHLDRRYRRIHSDDHCIIYQLSGADGG
jgi:hypothetical protein